MEDTTMKKYINPNTEVHEIELAQMIAGTNVQFGEGFKATSSADAQEGEMTETSGSIWGEEE